MIESQDMKYEEVRLDTFRSWPANAKVEAWKMAKAGLQYTGLHEEVKCTFCGCFLNDWQYGDQVMSKHRQASPDCPFVKNTSDNVPLSGRRQPVMDHIQNTETDMVDGDTDEEDTDHVNVDTRTIPDLSEGGLTAGSSPMEVSEQNRLHEDMRLEQNRLNSFENWSLPFIRPEDLAKAGFYYINQHDNCRCAFCDNCVGDWEEGDVPMEEHAKLFPLCPFVRGVNVGNVRRSAANQHNSRPQQPQQPAASSSSSAPGHDETGLRWYRNPNSGPEKGFPCSQYPESLGIISHHGPLHPSYATVEARIRTFRDWPPALKQQPEELADAGFYYIGLSDQVKCFYCDGGLRNWQPEDNPWVEHARWFTKCVFVRLRKGDEFIQQSIATKPPAPSEELAGESRDVTEDEVRAAMSAAVVKQVLSMGLEASRVKMAIKKQLQNYGCIFDTPESLINAAFSVQRQQERRVNNEGTNGAMLETRRSVDEVTSRHWEFSSEDEDELQVHSSLPASVNLNPSRGPSNPVAITSPPPPPPPPPSVSTDVPPPTPKTPAAVPSVISPPITAVASTTADKKAEAVSLEDENARLKEQRTCKVCMDGEVGVVFLPCGHLICCVNCAPSLKDCPVCRCNIQGTVRTFMS